MKDDVTVIFGMMRDMFEYCESGKRIISIDSLVQRIQAKGFSKQALDTTLRQYMKMDVIMEDQNGNILLVDQ